MSGLFASIGWLAVFTSGLAFIISLLDTSSNAIMRDIQRTLDITTEDFNQVLIQVFVLGVIMIVLGRILKFVSGANLRRSGLGIGLHPENPLPSNNLLPGRHDHGMINVDHAVGTLNPAQAQADANAMVFNNLANQVHIAPESMIKQVEQAYKEGKITNEQYQTLRRTASTSK